MSSGDSVVVARGAAALEDTVGGWWGGVLGASGRWRADIAFA